MNNVAPVLSKSFNPDVRDRMYKKLTDIITYIEKVKIDKKAMADGFNEDLKAANKRMCLLTRSIEEKDLTLLKGVFFDDEINMFISGKK